MDEKLIDYFFGFAQSKGFKKNREDFVKYLQSDDKLFDYLYGVAESKGYKRDKEHFAGLVGRTTTAAPASTESVNAEPVKTEAIKTEVVNDEPIKTEVVNAEPAKTTELVKTEPVAEETVTDYSGVDTTPMDRKGERSTPIKGIDQITVEKVDLSDKEKADRLKSVRKGIDEQVVNDAIESKLMPVTEKTQVKEVVPEEKKKEIPTDIKVKDVTQESSKLKIKDIKKISASPLDVISNIKLKPNDYVVDKVPGKEVMPSEVYKPYGEKGPDVYYSKDSDQYIIKNGDERILINKGSEKYEEITKKIEQSVGTTRQGKGECGPANPASCSPTQNAIADFINWSGDDFINAYRTSFEGNLANLLDRRKSFYDDEGQSFWKAHKDDEGRESEGDLYYANENLPKDKRFIIYKPYGDDKTLIYDKNSDIILKQLDQKAPMVNISDIKSEGEDHRQAYQRYLKQNPNEGLNVWQAVELDNPEYKELKSLINGINYKKGTKNTFVPLSPNSFDPTGTPEWMKPQGASTQQPQVEEKKIEPMKEATKVEPMKEMKGNTSVSKPITVNGIKIDDNINLGETFFPSSKRGDLHKLANTKDLTLDEIVDKFTSKYNVAGMGSTVVLDKNISLNFPDPPNVKTKNSVDQNDENIFETKIEGKNIYSYFDDKNNKWYTYTKGSNKENWTEVKSPPIKQILNTKYKDDKGEIDKSKIFKITEEEADKILKIKEHYFYNRYLPYIVSNYDQLNQPQKEKVKSFLNINFFNQKISRDIYNEWYKESDNPDYIWGEKYDNFWEYAVKKIGLDIDLEKEKSSKRNYPKKTKQ